MNNNIFLTWTTTITHTGVLGLYNNISVPQGLNVAKSYGREKRTIEGRRFYCLALN